MEHRSHFHISSGALIFIFNAVVFAIPPWHKHDWVVASLFMALALYEARLSAVSAGDTNG